MTDSQFKILRFSVSPEFEQHVNVALLVHSEKVTRIVHDGKFERFQHEMFDKDYLRFWLDELSKSLKWATLEEASQQILSSTSQFQLSKSHSLLVEGTENVLAGLLKTFCGRKGAK